MVFAAVLAPGLIQGFVHDTRVCVGAKHAVKHEVAKMLISYGLISCTTDDEYSISTVPIDDMRMCQRL